MALLFIGGLQENYQQSLTHSAAWSVLLSWSLVLLQIGKKYAFRKYDWFMLNTSCFFGMSDTYQLLIFFFLLCSKFEFRILFFNAISVQIFCQKTANTQCWIEWYPNYIIFSFFLLADCPCLGVYIYILQVVLLDIVAFFISVLALILGFAFAFHLILQKSSSTKEGDQNLFKNPITSLIAVLTMAVGHFGVSDEVMASSLVPGTTEAMFVIFYFLFSIGKCKLLFVHWLY